MRFVHKTEGQKECNSMCAHTYVCTNMLICINKQNKRRKITQGKSRKRQNKEQYETDSKAME